RSLYTVLTLLQLCVYLFFFFFQAEDGIRDWSVTGVQTCALPIFDVIVTAGEGGTRAVKEVTSTIPIVMGSDDDPVTGGIVASLRSEERRVGEEGRVRGGGGDVKKKREKE